MRWKKSLPRTREEVLVIAFDPSWAEPDASLLEDRRGELPEFAPDRTHGCALRKDDRRATAGAVVGKPENFRSSACRCCRKRLTQRISKNGRSGIRQAQEPSA